MSAATAPTPGLESLLAPATIGTDRAGTSAPDALLVDAAIHGLRARAGRRPASGARLVQPAPADEARIASAAALEILARAMSDEDASLIDEWFALARARGVLLRDTFLPAILDRATTRAIRQSDFAPVVGRRGAWLSAMRSEWRDLLDTNVPPDELAERWRTGTRAERTAALTAMRRREPARALALIAETWANEAIDERRTFLETLHHGLSMHDEPFLETALDDASKQVRRVAASLLAELPASRFRARMNERARSIVRVETVRRGLLRRTSVEVTITPPASFDKAWVRDAVDERAPAPFGERAWWMRQILAAADLSVWRPAAGDAHLTPTETLAAIEGSDHRNDALDALVNVARRSDDAAWCIALIEARRRAKLDWGLVHTWRELATNAREGVLAHIAPISDDDDHSYWEALATHTSPWSPEFSRTVVRFLRSARPVNAVRVWSLTSSIARVARTIWVGVCNDFEQALLHQFGSPLPEQIGRSVDCLRLRAEMHKEFGS